MAHLLEGIKVLDLASFLAGPGASTLMADYGADVIKIEPPGGDGYRRLHGVHHTDYNWQLTSRNKKGMALDIGQEEGRRVLKRLLGEADVLVTNFREDQLKKYELGYDTVRSAFPRLIYAQLTGYGNVGPDKKRRGYDATAWWARTGIMRLMKARDAAPVFPAGGVGDHATAMSLFAGIMMALYKRQLTGEGSHVETSLIANGCWANGMALQGAIAGFDLAELLDRKVTRSPFAMVYETRDERHVILVLTNPAKEWHEIARALGHPEWTEDERYSSIRDIMRRREEVRDLFAGVIGSMTLSEVCAALDKYHLTFGVVEGLSDVVKDAHLIENEVVVKTGSDDPNFAWTINNPIKIQGENIKPAVDPPTFGEHTLQILAQHGFDAEQVETLIRDKIVFAAED